MNAVELRPLRHKPTPAVRLNLAAAFAMGRGPDVGLKALDASRMKGRLPFAEDLHSGLDPAAVERPEDGILLSELKVGCARALLQCLDGDHRIAYVLGEIMELEGSEAAEILGIDAAAFRKRLSRARVRIETALRAQCGIVNPAAACLCHRRLARAKSLGRVGVDPPEEEPPLDLVTLRRKVQDCESLERVAAYYRADPAPQARRDFVRAIRGLIQTRQLS